MLDRSAPDSVRRSELRTHRAMILIGVVAIPGFWVLDRLEGLVYDDPIGYRLAVAAVALVLLGLTYLDDRVRRHVRRVMLGVVYMIAAFFAWTAARNGLTASWASGLCMVLLMGGLIVTLYARSSHGTAGALGGLLAAIVVPLLLTEPPAGGMVHSLGAFVGVLLCSSTSLYVAGVARLRMLQAFAAQRDEVVVKERLLRTVVDAIPAHVYVKDRQGRCLIRNAFSARVMGFDDPEDAVGLTAFDTSEDPDVAAAYWAEEDAVMTSGEPTLDREEPYVYDGREGRIVTSRVPLRDESGDVIGLVGVTRDVTEQRAAEDSLRQAKEAAETSRRLLWTIVDTIPDHIYAKDLEGRATLRNAASARALGYDHARDSLGVTDMEATGITGEAARRAFADDLQVIRTGRPIVDKVEPLEGGGSVRWLSTTKVPLRDADGQTIGLVGISRDVTEAKDTEASLREAKEAAEASQRLLQTVIDAIPDHIFVVGRDGRFILGNEAGIAGTRVPSNHDLVGRTPHDVFDEEVASRIQRGLRPILDTGEPIYHSEHPLPGGENRVGSTSRVPLRDADGAVVGVVGVTRDVTHQRRAQAELESQKRLLQATIDALPLSVVLMDAECRVVLANAEAERSHAGWGGLLGKTPADVFPAEAAPKLEGRLRGVLDRGVAADPFVHPMGAESGAGTDDERVGETTHVPLHDAEGRAYGVIAVTRDVTEQRRARAALVSAKEAAEAATRAKSEFLANMSHEIRTPMNGVVGMTSLLLDTALDPEQAEFVETIRTSGDALLTIINDILDFSKIEAGMLDLERHAFDVRACVEDALDLVAQAAAGKGVELAYAVADGVPAEVVGDVTRVRQVLVNLLSNAVKFTPDGSVCVRVSAEPTDAGVGARVELRFAVEDTGVGIPPDKLDHVFGSFTQVDASTTRQYGGTGLGLAICRRLVGMMGGAVSAESAVGAGSTFRFTVACEVAPSERRVHLRPDQPALAGRRVLVVDDTAVNREILVRLAARWRMEPVEVPSGPEALEAVARAEAEGRPYELVLLDMQMPGMDGVQVAEALQARAAPGAPRPVVVMLTSVHRDSALRRDAEAAGVHAVLYKPTKPAQLHAVLLDAFGSRPDEGLPGSVAGAAWVARPADRPADPPPVADPALHVLLAEDNAVNQKVALRLLGRLGLSADVVADGVEAVAAVEARARAGRPYDVVLMDVQMPEMDGLEATRRIRAAGLGRQPHVIALTANAMEGDREACLEAGCDDYVAKPVRLESVREALERVPAEPEVAEASPPAAG